MPELELYWRRTLRSFVGRRVRVTLEDGRVRDGVVSRDGESLDVPGGRTKLPLGDVRGVTMLPDASP